LAPVGHITYDGELNIHPTTNAEEIYASIRFLYSARLTNSPPLRSRMFDRDRNTRSFLPSRSSVKRFPTNADVCGSRRLSTGDRRSLLAPSHLAKRTPDPKPSLDAVMSQAQIEKKVGDYLRNSQALEDYWQRPPTAEQLQSEMERMAKHTKQPDVLRELFEALGNDPFVIAECLARPALWRNDCSRIPRLSK
jgi:hypothetical protein